MSNSSNQSNSIHSTSTAVSNQARQAANRVAAGALEVGHDAAQHYVKEPAMDLISLAKAYAKDKPDVAACWAFGLGILVGWKLKP